MTFTDVTEQAGVNRNILYRNLGNGGFEDVTAKAGLTGKVWAISAGWLDYDRVCPICPDLVYCQNRLDS